MGRTQFSGSKYFGWQTWVRKVFEILTSNFDFSRFVPGSMPIYLCFWPKVSKLMKDFKRVQLKLIQYGFEWIWSLTSQVDNSLKFVIFGFDSTLFWCLMNDKLYNNLHFWLHYRMYGTGKLWPALNFIKIIVNILYYWTKRGK